MNQSKFVLKGTNSIFSREFDLNFLETFGSSAGEIFFEFVCCLFSFIAFGFQLKKSSPVSLGMFSIFENQNYLNFWNYLFL